MGALADGLDRKAVTEAGHERDPRRRDRGARDVGAGLGPGGGDLDPHPGHAAGLSPSRVHQIVAAADLDALDAALGELRAAGWPAPEDPDSGEDTELDGRDNIADRPVLRI
jgi:hypothetical protein